MFFYLKNCGREFEYLGLYYKLMISTFINKKSSRELYVQYFFKEQFKRHHYHCNKLDLFRDLIQFHSSYIQNFNRPIDFFKNFSFRVYIYF